MGGSTLLHLLVIFYACHHLLCCILNSALSSLHLSRTPCYGSTHNMYNANALLIYILESLAVEESNGEGCMTCTVLDKSIVQTTLLL